MRTPSLLAKAISTAACAAFALCLTPLIAFANPTVGSTFTEGGLTYKVTSETECAVGAQDLTSTDYLSPAGEVVIPSQAGGLQVTGIADNAFGKNGEGSALTAVTIPDSVKSIGKDAFRSCKQLATVNLGKDSSLRTVGNYAFYECTSLEALTVPSSVTKLGMYSLSGCPSLTSLEFQDPQATTPSLDCQEGTLSLSSIYKGKMESLELPARLLSVPANFLKNRSGLKVLTFAGEKVSFFGTRALYCCSDLERLELPRVSATSNKIGANALTGLNSLTTLVFTGDEDLGLGRGSFGYASNVNDTSNGNPVTHYSPISTIIYYGSHTSDLSSFEAATYQAVYYHRNQEDAEGRAEPLARVLVRNDVTLGSIPSLTPETGLLEGTVPALADGQSWFYKGGNALSTADTRYDAFPVSNDDLSFGTVALSAETLPYTGKAAEFTYRVIGPDGTELAEGTDYQISYADAEGNPVQRDQIKALGTYTISATGKGAYSGTTSSPLVVGMHECTWKRTSGNMKYTTPNHMLDEAFTAADTDTVIVVGPAALSAGAALGGLAGVRDAAIVASETDSPLDLEAIRTLRFLSPESVILIGVSDATAATKQITDSLDKNVTVTNAFAANSQEEMASLGYTRTKSKGYWDDATHALVARVDDVPGAIMAGRLAYAQHCPVFLASSTGALIDDAAKAMSQDFKEVLCVGKAAVTASVTERSLLRKGYTGSVSSLDALNDFALSVSVCQQLVDQDLTKLDKATLVSPQDPFNGVTAISACGRLDAPLLFFDEASAEGRVALDQLIAPNRYYISQGYLFATTSRISTAVQHELETLYSFGDEFDLACATVEIDQASFSYDGAGHLPAFTVKDVNGKEVPQKEDIEQADGTTKSYTNYSVYCTRDLTDKRSQKGGVEAGAWTITIAGYDRYFHNAFASFQVTPADASGAKLALSSTSYTYNGSAKKPGVTVTLNGAVMDPSTYSVAYKNNKYAGKGSVTVAFKGNYQGSTSAGFTINKATNPLSAKASKKTVKRSLKKSVYATIAASKAYGGTTFKVKSYPKKAGKYVTISSKGKVTFKKKAPKGWYSFTVKAKGTANYKSKTVTVKIKVA
ncbi:MAG: leucine-rich repeat protein [Coriobacteriia bacterium]|nr:leucine-rich repeat protein [Coriobacteriia bacterium]